MPNELEQASNADLLQENANNEALHDKQVQLCSRISENFKTRELTSDAPNHETTNENTSPESAMNSECSISLENIEYIEHKEHRGIKKSRDSVENIENIKDSIEKMHMEAHQIVEMNHSHKLDHIEEDLSNLEELINSPLEKTASSPCGNITKKSHPSSLFEAYNQALEPLIEKLNKEDSSIEVIVSGESQDSEVYPSKPSKSIEEISLELLINPPSEKAPLRAFAVIENYFAPHAQEEVKSKAYVEQEREIIEKVVNGISLTLQEAKLLRKIRVALAKKKIWEEYRILGYNAQFNRDADLWYKTLEKGGDRAAILQRMFTVLRYGGLLFKEWTQAKNPHARWIFWRKRGWPIATALSHGSRIIIQLDREREDGKGGEFWNWLITGYPDKDASDYISTSTTSEKARKHGKILFKRLGATHSLDFSPQKMQFKLPANRKKIIHEIKTFGLKDSKVLAGRRKSLMTHSHWGMNIPVGGLHEEPYLYKLTKKEIPLTKEEEAERIDTSGRWGHMYIYYLVPTKDRYGALMLGVETSEPNIQDSMGETHTIQAKSPLLSPTFGYKWWKKGNKPDLRICYGPSKYNGLLIDLSEGWEFLMSRTWKNEYVKETAEKPRALPPLQLDKWLRENIQIPKGFDRLV